MATTSNAEFKVCHECKSDDIPIQATRCKHCGANLKSFYNKNIGWYLIGIIFLLAGFGFWPLWIVALICFILGTLSNR
jgi:ribosomal protein L40E